MLTPGSLETAHILRSTLFKYQHGEFNTSTSVYIQYCLLCDFNLLFLSPFFDRPFNGSHKIHTNEGNQYLTTWQHLQQEFYIGFSKRYAGTNCYIVAWSYSTSGSISLPPSATSSIASGFRLEASEATPS